MDDKLENMDDDRGYEHEDEKAEREMKFYSADLIMIINDIKKLVKEKTAPFRWGVPQKICFCTCYLVTTDHPILNLDPSQNVHS